MSRPKFETFFNLAILFVLLLAGWRPIAEAVGRIFHFTDQGEARFYEDAVNGQNYLSVKAPAALAGTLNFSWPPTSGTSGQVIRTDGNGVLTFVDAAGGTVIDVKAHGAIGNGVANDTAAIQSALNAAEATVGGAIVFFTPGDYLVDELVIDGPEVTVQGSIGTILRQRVAAANVIEVRSTEDVTIRDLEFIGVGYAFPLVSTSDDNGVRITSTAGTPAIGDVKRIRVSNCIFRGFRFQGVLAEYVEGILFEDCQALNCHSSFAFWACRDGEMRGCYADASMSLESDPNLPGCFAFHMNSTDTLNCENVRWVNCTVRNRNNCQPFLAHSGIGIKVIGCTVINSVGGIDVFPASIQPLAIVSDVFIVGCDIGLSTTGTPYESPVGTPNAGNKGITVGGKSSAPIVTLQRAVIANNTIRNANRLGSLGPINSWGGIVVGTNTNGLKIIGNDISGCGASGIYFQGDNNNDFLVEGNRINGVVAGISTPGACIAMQSEDGGMTGSNGLITGNHLDDSPEGIRVHSLDSPATSVRVFGNVFGSGLTTRIAGYTNEDFLVYGALSVTGASTLTGAVSAPAGVTGNLSGAVTGNVTGNLTGSVTGGTGAVFQAGDVEWHRNAANVWGTPDSLTVDASLNVLGLTTTARIAYGAPTELTIDTNGDVTVTGSFHIIDTFADAASDNLDTINGGVGGQILHIRTANNARDVVVDQTGNIDLDSSSVTLLESVELMTFIYDSTQSKWLEIVYSNN